MCSTWVQLSQKLITCVVPGWSLQEQPVLAIKTQVVQKKKKINGKKKVNLRFYKCDSKLISFGHNNSRNIKRNPSRSWIVHRPLNQRSKSFFHHLPISQQQWMNWKCKCTANIVLDVPECNTTNDTRDLIRLVRSMKWQEGWCWIWA